MRHRILLALGGVAAGLAAAWRWIGPVPDEDSGVLGPRQVIRLYDRLAPSYDLLVGVYRLLGSRRLARRGIDALALRPGDTVIDLGVAPGRCYPSWPMRSAPGGGSSGSTCRLGCWPVPADAPPAALAPRQGRIAIPGLRAPQHWPPWAGRAGIALTRPLGAHEDYLTFRPWQAIRTHATEIGHRTAGAGALYLSVGQAH